MTNEKALIYLKNLRARKLKDYSVVFDTTPKDSVVYGAVSAEIEIYDTAIKALEQEPILDKIRAEIEQIEIKGYIRDVECFNAGINTALNIIDKYKTESEG